MGEGKANAIWKWIVWLGAGVGGEEEERDCVAAGRRCIKLYLRAAAQMQASGGWGREGCRGNMAGQRHAEPNAPKGPLIMIRYVERQGQRRRGRKGQGQPEPKLEGMLKGDMGLPVRGPAVPGCY